MEQFTNQVMDYLWGGQLANGTWTGLTGDLVNERTEVGVAQFFIAPSRIKFMDFTAPYEINYACFLLKKPPPLPSWTSITFPMQLYTWLALRFINYCFYHFCSEFMD